MSRWLRSSGVKLLGLAHVLLNVPALPRISNAGVRTVLFVMQMLPLPVKPQTWVSREPVREAVTFPLSYGQGTADIYRIPGGKVRAGVLVFFGINPAPRDDHRVVNLGKGLARAGFVAMFAWSPSLMGKRIDAAEPDNLVWAFRYLRELEYVDPDRVGMGGFCVGASMAILAASDPRINAEVNFVSSFGCYYDMADMVKQVASNRSFYCHTVKPWDPNDLTQEVLTNQLIEGLEEERERDLLASIFIGEGVAAEGPSLDGLSTEGKTVCRLLSSLAARAEERRLTLEEADRLVHELPPRIQAELTKLSPSANIGNLKARLLIAHDREDDLVPSQESRRLADALSNRGDFHYAEFSFFSHVTPNKRVGPFIFMKEAFKLFRYTYNVIRVAA